ncbi:MAG TPA: DoxX family protein [Opitutaceae bacterium]|nr:DoxX family protein [Opitutaceae bacterium]
MESTTPAVSKSALWTGRVMSILPCLMLLFSGVMKIMQTEEVVEGFATWPPGSAVAIGVVEIACTIVYLIPRTAVLGALLLIGYLGGAVAVSVQMGVNFALPLIFGVLVWGGLWLRDPRLRALTPLVKR